ncbi:hypothetical protein NQ314_019922, partial [Rhamnusium bicolor]
DLNDFQWSTSISIINDNEQFVRIPYYGDIKLTIINSACTTFLIIDSVSQVEISARDIRVRLSMHEIEGPIKLKEKSDFSSASISKLSASEDLGRSLSDTSVPESRRPQSGFQKLPTVAEQSHIYTSVYIPAKRRWSDTTMTKSSTTTSLLVNTLPMKDIWS